MKKRVFYNGILYQIEYQPQLSNADYTEHQVYYIYTEENNYSKAHQDIAAIMENILGIKDIWDKGLYVVKNQNSGSFATAMHVYHEFTYDSNLDAFIYTFVRPYDD